MPIYLWKRCLLPHQKDPQRRRDPRGRNLLVLVPGATYTGGAESSDVVIVLTQINRRLTINPVPPLHGICTPLLTRLHTAFDKTSGMRFETSRAPAATAGSSPGYRY